MLARAMFDDVATLYRSETNFPCRFTAQVLTQALDLSKATPLEAARSYASIRPRAYAPYLFV